MFSPPDLYTNQCYRRGEGGWDFFTHVLILLSIHHQYVLGRDGHQPEFRDVTYILGPSVAKLNIDACIMLKGA